MGRCGPGRTNIEPRRCPKGNCEVDLWSSGSSSNCSSSSGCSSSHCWRRRRRRRRRRPRMKASLAPADLCEHPSATPCVHCAPAVSARHQPSQGYHRPVIRAIRYHQQGYSIVMMPRCTKGFTHSGQGWDTAARSIRGSCTRRRTPGGATAARRTAQQPGVSRAGCSTRG